MNGQPSNQPSPEDVRMKGFRRRSTVSESLAWLRSQLAPMPAESISVLKAHRRVLASPIASERNVPAFRRAMMDGFAVTAEETAGASTYNKIRLRVIGDSLPGTESSPSLETGTAIRIMTGSPMPPKADAVVPVEQTESDGEEVCLSEQVSQGKHVAQIGEDIRHGETVLSTNHQLRPQDIGLLCSIGITDVQVYARPRVRLIVTGNELVPAGTKPSGSQIVDSNSPMLTGLIERDGGEVIYPGIVRDVESEIRNALVDDCDVILVSGGSSVGIEDHAPRLVRSLGELPIHGVAMRPSSPAGLGRIEHRLVFLLPGNPVSCLCAYDFFAGRAIRQLSGRSWDWPYQRVTGTLERKLSSAIGRVDYARVQYRSETTSDDESSIAQLPEQGRVTPIAISGASLLSSTTRADGFVVVPADLEGYPAGDSVTVQLYADRFGH